ncbi:MAG TPA: asparagine synthase (glutamine-hydrolyzing) [Patescibacteria group bacterium]|jgi:asparagine synthase (glutamine-hydrolysing)|nr:asparagine synthase (glutamine-hydrolyzing) [Patescibacteria group bacterium]
MCGIAGYFGFAEDKQLLRTMNDAQVHRGPDGEGIFADGLIGLAQRRLAIIDRPGGTQPMFNHDKTLAITYNGEVYNYQELRAELEQSGVKFKTKSDTEVVLQAYAVWGEEAFDRFNGMFALAIYDKKHSRLVLARDHFGIKPLYFANVGTEKQPKVLFASEIKTLLASGKVLKRVNERVLYRYLKFRIHEDSNETFFDGIHKIMPGEMMTLDVKGLKLKPYTKLQAELNQLAQQNQPYNTDQAEYYRSALTESIKARLISEVPVGTSFSGGLDSSTIVAVINQLMHDNKSATQSVGAQQNTFSAIFPGAVNDEEAYVDELLKVCKNHVSAHKIRPDADGFVQDLNDFIRTQEEPLISTGPYAQYKVMQEATKHVTVMLDGQAADEIMAGYIPYYFVYLRQLKAHKQWIKLIVELLGSVDIFARFARVNLKERILRKRPVPMNNLLGKQFRHDYAGQKFSPIQNNLKARLIQDVFYNSLPALLRYEDKNTMRFSIEGRVPFLDKEVIKYLFTLNDQAIIKSGWNKRILRDATKGLLPEMINRRRNKIGFTTPEYDWFIRLKNRFYNIFLSESFAARPYFNQPAVLEAFEGFIKGDNDSTSMLFWRLLNVELWLREFFDDKVEMPKESIKTDFEPNEDKQLDIKAGEQTYRRYALRTELVSSKDDLNKLVSERVRSFFDDLAKQPKHAKYISHPWYLLISEKVVAITQGRSYFVWDIKPGWWASTLARQVTKTPAGIGLGSPWTMQLAIQEVGLARILYASIGGAIGKLVGKRGVFYNLVGSDVRAIDGPTEYSVYPSNVSAKLAPKDPTKVANQLTDILRANLPSEFSEQFKGCVIIDSNDIGRNVLGQNTNQPDKLFEDIFGDNPLGQSHEQTPLSIVIEK